MALAADDLAVYPRVPRQAVSEHYTVRISPAKNGTKWRNAFAWRTACKSVKKHRDAYFTHFAGWTLTYVNFETAGPVEVEISRATSQPIHNAAAHPKHKALAVIPWGSLITAALDDTHMEVDHVRIYERRQSG